MTRFDGAVAVVTGGGSGIGRALAHEAASRSMSVVVADVDEPRAAAVARGIAADGGHATAVHCDVTDLASVETLAAAALDTYGGVNLVCLNAGVAAGGTVEAASSADLGWIFEVNVFGVYHGAHTFMPLLRDAARRGDLAHVLCTGSEHSLGVPPYVGAASVYTASKHAVLGFADALRRDGADDGIGVTIFCPSVVATDLWDSKRTRPDRYGGAVRAPHEVGERFAARGLSADLTASRAFAGVEQGEFIVLTDPIVLDFVEARAHEMLAAVQRRRAAPAN